MSPRASRVPNSHATPLPSPGARPARSGGSVHPVLLIEDLRRLPPKLWNATVYLLRSGYSAAFVSKWLLAQGYRGGAQLLSAEGLSTRVECLQRRVKPFANGDKTSRDLASSRNAKGTNVNDSRIVVPTAANAVRLVLFLWWVAHVPAPLLQEFLRVLTEGGEVRQQVLRLASRLKAGCSNQPASENRDACRVSGRSRRPRGVSRYRAAKGPGMLRSLAGLPLPVLQHAIFLLLHQVSALAVARFILCHQDLGRCPRSENTVRQYVALLRTMVLQESKPSPGRKRLLHQMAKNIQQQQVHYRMTVTARRLAASGPHDPRTKLPISQVQSLSGIKAELLALFARDPKLVLAQIAVFIPKVTETTGRPGSMRGT
jgi:hypothetical protein